MASHLCPGWGGNADDVGTPGRCFGGGGGGSGGVIYFNGASPAGTISTAGGTGGLEFNRSGTCLAAIPGLNGSSGSFVNNYTYRRGNVFGSICGSMLPASIAYFKAVAERSSVKLTWKMYNPSNVSQYIIERMNTGNTWKELQTIQAFDDQESYVAVDAQPISGDNYYRIKIIHKSNVINYSPTRYVFISANNDFLIYPNPATDKIYIRAHYNSPTSLELLDFKGNIVLRRKILSSLTEIPITTLPKGIYAVRIGDIVKKLIVQ